MKKSVRALAMLLLLAVPAIVQTAWSDQGRGEKPPRYELSCWGPFLTLEHAGKIGQGPGVAEIDLVEAELCDEVLSVLNKSILNPQLEPNCVGPFLSLIPFGLPRFDDLDLIDSDRCDAAVNFAQVIKQNRTFIQALPRPAVR